MSDDRASAGQRPTRVTGSPQSHHRILLVVALLVVMLSFALTVLPGGERVALRGIEAYPLPQSCVARGFNAECPGCGLTRSFVFLAEGDVSASFASNRVGWLFALLVLFQIPYRYLVLRRRKSYMGNALPMVVGFSLAFLLLANWIWNLIRG